MKILIIIKSYTVIYASVVYVYRKNHLLYINHVLLDIIEVRNTNEPSFRKLQLFVVYNGIQTLDQHRVITGSIGNTSVLAW